MGIFKKLINKVLDAEVPPVIEKLVKKENAKKQVKEKTQTKKARIVPKIGKVMYSERYIPDDSDEAKQIRAHQEVWGG
jgi:ribosomal protein S8